MMASNRTIAFNVIGLLLIKAISMGVSLATIPVLLSYFKQDKEALGVWLAFFTLITVAISLDLGIGNRIKNDILGKVSLKLDYSDLVRKSFETQIFVAIIVATMILAGGLAVRQTSNNFSGGGQEILQDPALLAFSVLFVLIIMPLRLSYFILQAQQRNAASALVVLVPQLAVILYAAIANRISCFDLTLPALAIVLFITTFLAYLMSFSFAHQAKNVFQFSLRKKICLPLLISDQIKNLKPGLPFFAIQVSIIFLYSHNELYYLIFGDVVDIVHYQYYFRPLSLFSVGFSLISLPFWSAIRLSQLQKNRKRTRNLMVTIIVLNVPVAIALVATNLFFQEILDIWLGRGVFAPERSMLIIFSLSTLLTCIMHALSSILSGYDLIGFQARILGVGLVIKILALYALDNFIETVDPVMMSTVAGLFFVAFGFSFKIYAQLKNKKFFVDSRQ